MSTEKLIFSTSKKFKVVSIDRVADLANIYVISLQKNAIVLTVLNLATGFTVTTPAR